MVGSLLVLKSQKNGTPSIKDPTSKVSLSTGNRFPHFQHGHTRTHKLESTSFELVLPGFFRKMPKAFATHPSFSRHPLPFGDLDFHNQNEFPAVEVRRPAGRAPQGAAGGAGNPERATLSRAWKKRGRGWLDKNIIHIYIYICYIYTYIYIYIRYVYVYIYIYIIIIQFLFQLFLTQVRKQEVAEFEKLGRASLT